MKSKYLFILLTFSATIAQGYWHEWVDDEAIVVGDIPLFLLFLFGRKRLKQAPYTKGALVLTVLFFLWSHIGVFFAPNQLYFRQELFLNIRACLYFIAFISFVSSKEDLHSVFLGFAIGLLFQGMIGIHHWLRGPVGLGFLGEQRIGWQAQGTFVHASVFGFYVSLLSVIMYRIGVFLRPRHYQFYLLVFLIGVISLYASQNRATWLAFAATMVVMFVFDLLRREIKTRHSKRYIALIVLVLIAGGIRYGTVIMARFSDAEESLADDRSSSRMSLAQDAMRIIKEHSLTGTGLNNYRMYVSEETAGTRVVHCTYLLVTAELGIPGGVIFILLILSFLVVGLRAMRSNDFYLKNSATALVMAQSIFIIAMLPSPDYRILYVKTHIWMIWGLTLATAKIDYFHKKMAKRSVAMAGDPRARNLRLQRPPHNRFPAQPLPPPGHSRPQGL
ncbi:MAG TPA: O-antigen ligase family protein [bacterium]|nr:O-antigen ligase family protein [bacterium]HNT65135.1 O-antigen ligase family protein [bacterium]